jgi:hypothetical protein
MAGFTERLALVIDADGKGAIKEFEKVSAASGKSLGDTDSKLAKASGSLTTFGIGAVNAGALVAGGMFKMAQAAGDLGESMSAAGVIFGDGVKTVEKFGDAAAKTAGLSKKAAVDGAVTFGTFGKAAGLAGEDLAGFSTEMLQLAGDLASFKNTSPEQAIEAIGSALRGEAEPIRAYGVLLDDATLGQEAMAQGLITTTTQALTPQQKVLAAHAAILKQTGDAQGDFVRTGDSMANQQKAIKAEMDNLVTSIGTAALPTFKALTTAVGDAVGFFNGLPEPIKNTVGQLGAMGGVGLVAVGGLSLIAGQLSKGGDLWQKYGKDAGGGTTKLGAAAKGVGAAFAVIAAIGLGDSLIKGITGTADKLEDSRKRMKVAADGTTHDVLDAFGKLSQDFEGDQGFFKQISESFGKNVAILPGQADAAIENIQRAFESLTIPEQGKVISALKEYGTTLDAGSQQAKDNDTVLRNLSDRYKLNGDAAKAGADDIDAATGAQKTNTGAVEDSADAIKRATDFWKDYGDALKAQFDPLFGAVKGTKDLKKAQDDAKGAQMLLTEAVEKHGPKSLEAMEATDKLNQANQDAVEAALGNEGAMATLRAEIEKNPDALDKAKWKLAEWVAQGKITKDQADLVLWGFAQVGGEAKKLDGTSVDIDVDADTSKATTKLDALGRKIDTLTATGHTPVAPGQPALPGFTLNADGSKRKAVGGVMAAGEGSWVGEEGPEFFQAGASGYIIPNNRLTGSVMPQGGDGGSVTNIFHVSMVAGDQAAIDDMIVNSLSRVSRGGGTIKANITPVS